MVFGTFDILHEGHLDLFKQAKKYGDFLIVAVAHDDTVKKIKGKFPTQNQKKRINAVRNIPIVDKAVLGRRKGYYKNLEIYRPDVICLGYDQKAFVKKLRKELKKMDLSKTKIVRLKAHKPHIYKSSKLKKKLV